MRQPERDSASSVGPRILLRKLLEARCKAPKSSCEPNQSLRSLRSVPMQACALPPCRMIASPNEDVSGWDDFKIGAGVGATLTGVTAAWVGSPIIPAVLGGAFGGGTMGYSYFQLSRFFEERHQRSDAVTHCLAGSASGYLYASILYGPKSIKAGAIGGGLMGLAIYFGAESLKVWRHEAALKRRIARADRMIPPEVRELDRALDAGQITEKEHAEYRRYLIRHDRSRESAEAEYAALQAEKRAHAQGQAVAWPRWLPLQKMSDAEVAEREQRAALYREVRMRMEAAPPEQAQQLDATAVGTR